MTTEAESTFAITEDQLLIVEVALVNARNHAREGTQLADDVHLATTVVNAVRDRGEIGAETPVLRAAE